MNTTELAQALLEWQTKAIELQQLENEIKDAVLQGEKTLVVGRARATYYKPRASYQYELVADLATPEEIARHTALKEVVDWKAVCQEIEWDPPVEHTPARVVIKLDTEQ